MLIKNKLIKIDEDIIFAYYELDRKDTIEDLSKLIISNNEKRVSGTIWHWLKKHKSSVLTPPL